MTLGERVLSWTADHVLPWVALAAIFALVVTLGVVLIDAVRTLQ